MHKSTHKTQKNSKSLHTEPDMDEDELPPTKQGTPAPDDDNIYVNDNKERTFMLREEEEESDRDGEEIDKDQRDNEQEEEANDSSSGSDKPETVEVVPQKRKKGKDTKKSASKSYLLFLPLWYVVRSSSEWVNRHQSEEVTMTCKITYNLAIFSVAKLAKPQVQCEPAARFVVLPSDLEWLDVHTHLKIKADNVLFPDQAAINDNAYETTFCIAWHIPNPLPLSCIGDYKHLVENALCQQQPTVKIIIKEIARPQVQFQVCIYPPSNWFLQF